VKWLVRLFSIFATAAFILAAPLRNYHAQPPSPGGFSISAELIQKASALRAALRRRPPAERLEPEYLDALAIYQRAVRLDEDRTQGDAALMAQADAYREMARQFQKPRYFYSALQCYAAILKDYSEGPFSTRALVGTAHIYEQDLADSDSAARAYSEIVRRFPASVSAREAQASLARLQTSSAERNPHNVVEAYSADDAAGVVTVSQVRHFSGPDYARVILDLTISSPYERRTEGSSLILKLANAKLGPRLLQAQTAVTPGGMLKRIQIAGKPDGAEIRIDCARLRDFAIFALDSPPRIVADLRGSRTIADDAEVAAGAQTAVPAQRTADGSITLLRALGLKVRRIVIDPGHGGFDTGAVSRDGTYEKDITLDIALRLRAAIQRDLKDVEIILTRDSDRFVPLEERTAIANAKQADLFISIHINSSPSSLASGVETYFLSLDASKDELEVATRENTQTSRNAGELQALLQRIVTDTKVVESRDFALHVQNSLVAGMRRVSPTASLNRGVKKAPFVVLLGANMPSILAEVAFISHPKDGDGLRTAEFRQSIAESLCVGVRSYIDTLSRSGAAPATP
jgi:N-acetylmuramoyl-L-alanine amidase